MRWVLTLRVKKEQSVILDMCVNDDNTMLATASSDLTVRVWNMQTWEPVAMLNIVSCGVLLFFCACANVICLRGN